MSGYILPYIKDRRQSLHIKPVNAYSDGFYIKDMEGREPDCAEYLKTSANIKRLATAIR